MWAAEKGQWEVCVKLAKLGADLDIRDKVRETGSDCSVVCYFIVVMMLSFFISIMERRP